MMEADYGGGFLIGTFMLTVTEGRYMNVPVE